MLRVNLPLSVFLFLLLGFASCNLNGKMNQFINSGDAGPGVMVTEKSFPVNAVQALEVVTSGGSISVTGDANEQARVEMHVKANNGKKYDEQKIKEILADEYEITIKEDNGLLRVHAKRKSTFWGNSPLSISFRIHTGKQLTTNLTTSGGSVSISSLLGKQSFRTSGGSLKISEIQGEVDGKTSGGSITIEKSQGNISLKTSGGSLRLSSLSGNIQVATSGGSIRVEDLQGELDAKTSGGSIRLENMQAKVDAATSGGSIHAQLNAIDGPISLRTSGGSISIAVPSNTAADLSLTGSRVNTEGNFNFQGTNNKGVMEGKLNGGGAPIHAITRAGSVSLSLK